jgi:magnesium chelatase family protein
LDFSDIKGQAYAKRGLEIAAAGRHNVLMVGPPGSGKTMLAKRFAGILPEITFEEAIETTKIHSVADVLSHKNAIVDKRPFRDPHHTISQVAMSQYEVLRKPAQWRRGRRPYLLLSNRPEPSNASK